MNVESVWIEKDLRAPLAPSLSLYIPPFFFLIILVTGALEGLRLAIEDEVERILERLARRRRVQPRQLLDAQSTVLVGAVHRLGDGTGALNHLHAVRGVALYAEAAAHHLVHLRVLPRGQQHRQRRDALLHVRELRLAQRLLVAGEVEAVVDDLEGDAEVVPKVEGQQLLRLTRGVREHSHRRERVADERRRLAEALLLVALDVEAAVHLHQLAGGQLLERGGHEDDHARHLDRRDVERRAREEVVPRQHRALGVVHLVQREPAAARGAVVYHVVVHERRRVDELSHLREAQEGVEGPGRHVVQRLQRLRHPARAQLRRDHRVGHQGDQRRPHELAALRQHVLARVVQHLVVAVHDEVVDVRLDRVDFTLHQRERAALVREHAAALRGGFG
ncbi:hypothetical protein STCU_05659 [Strigomonas culicis]|uniref:Uncharacterized protein n=1 Tax=Strigomonas culicis TaxID=28005 RepID=S9VKN2_9TRYP|nr:hypothetical protein STCU_05659 [Strigomonas culicis]|eukprot:EPY27621.1 hypothetical protein STCU_05659 [Strigomonas culicis]